MPWKTGRRKAERASDPCLTGDPLKSTEERQVWIGDMGTERERGLDRSGRPWVRTIIAVIRTTAPPHLKLAGISSGIMQSIFTISL